MSNSYRAITTSSLSCPCRGALQIVSLSAGAENATVALYDGTSAEGRFLYSLTALANSTESTPPLNLLYKTGIFADLSSNAQVEVTVE